METQQTLAHQDYSSNVDTSRPFRSVKEAVAILDERLLFGEIYSTKPFATHDNNNNNGNPFKEIVTSAWKYPSLTPTPFPQNPKKDDNAEQQELFDTLKKLEAELEGTKMELKSLKARGSETEIALATLNAELHKNMSKLAEAEAAAAAKKVETATRTVSRIDKERKEEERMRELMMIRMEDSPTLAQFLNIGENEKHYGGEINETRMNYMMMMMKKKKKKPIVPLVTDFFIKKKGASATLHNPLFASPNNYFN